MPSKQFGPTVILASQAVSSTTSYRTAAIDMRFMDTAALEVEWTGTPVGTLSVEASLDGSTWYPTGQQCTDPTGAGSTDNSLINCMGIGFAYLSLKYTNSSGSGTLTVTAVGKGLGA